MANFLGRPLGGRRLWPKRIRDHEPGVQRAPGSSGPGGGPIDLGVTARPGVASMSWAGPNPTISGGTISIYPTQGAATWTGPAPTVAVPVSVSPGVASMSWTGPAPTVTGLQADGQVIDRSANEVIDRSGNFVVNLAQS